MLFRKAVERDHAIPIRLEILDRLRILLLVPQHECVPAPFAFLAGLGRGYLLEHDARLVPHPLGMASSTFRILWFQQRGSWPVGCNSPRADQIPRRPSSVMRRPSLRPRPVRSRSRLRQDSLLSRCPFSHAKMTFWPPVSAPMFTSRTALSFSRPASPTRSRPIDKPRSRPAGPVSSPARILLPLCVRLAMEDAERGAPSPHKPSGQ